MKAFLTVFAVLALTVLLLGCVSHEECEQNNKKYVAVNHSYMKAMWLSQYDLVDIYTHGGSQRDKNDFEKRIEGILDNVVSLGINTVIVQVRPFGDSIYPSDVYPMSAISVGAYGKKATYDSFAIIVEQAHLRGLSVHAWINPLRLMRPDEIEYIDGRYAVRKWYDKSLGDMVSIVSGRLYLNPAYQSVRDLICEGIREIIDLYPVDGIHIDDYFYPTTDEDFDKIAYRNYFLSDGKMELAEFRREQVNSLVKQIYSTVKSANDSVLFGISPSGVMSNNYKLLYADVERWCREDGFTDYICPQIYFGFEHSTCAFDKVCDEFSSMIKNENVRLVIGMSLGKAASGYDAYAGDGKYEWTRYKDVLRRSFLYTVSLDNCSGISLFSYQHFFDPISGLEIESTAEERKGLIPLIRGK